MEAIIPSSASILSSSLNRGLSETGTTEMDY